MIQGAKGCPFCGNLESLKWFNNNSEEDTIEEILNDCGVASICCSIHDGGCGGTSGFYNTKYKILDKWNMRASPIWIKMKE